MSLPEEQLQTLAAEPRDHGLGLIEPCGDQQWVVGTLLELHDDLPLGDHQTRRGIDEVAEQMARLGDLVTLANADRQETVEAARHQRQLQIGRASCRERVYHPV